MSIQTIIKPRGYQQAGIIAALNAWNNNHKNLCLVYPTGAGKTLIKGLIAKNFSERKKYTIVFAHRDVLLSQISLSLAKLGVRHNLLCSNSTDKFIRDLHVKKTGFCFVAEDSKVCVASVPTFVRRNTMTWESLVSLWLMDECHHVLKNNIWGKAVSKLNNSIGAGFTATPIRGDGKGLGVNSGGVFDKLIIGPSLRDLINDGSLSDYKIAATDMAAHIHEQSKYLRLKGGEYDRNQAGNLTRSKIVVGDVVETYLKFAKGKRGITFATSIEHSDELASAYRSAGVNAVSLSAKTKDSDRWLALDKFTKGEILQLVNCDLFGEGFDVPSCHCASMVRLTKSYSLYSQQFGRALRTSENKKHAWIFDHVGNIEEHGLPDYGLDWTLDGTIERKRLISSTGKRLTRCKNKTCFMDYELPAPCCPFCGYVYTTPSRPMIKNIDGELKELTADRLEELKKKKRKINKKITKITGYENAAIARKITERHEYRRLTHEKLNDVMREWSAKAYGNGIPVDVAFWQFVEIFGVDPLTAGTLETKKAEELTTRVLNYGTL